MSLDRVLVNFEPDPRAESEKHGITVQVAIGPKNLGRIYLNQRPTTSSLLRPYKLVVDRYDFSRLSHRGDIFDTVDVQKVETFGLDEIVESKRLPRPDFLKIDVQGLTFEVLGSARNNLLNSVLGLQIEVEFVETYQGQKTFGAVHEYLYGMGFEIFKISNINQWFYKTNLNLRKTTGQDVFCDLLYLRNIDSIDDNPNFWNPNRAVRFIMICLLYDLTDTAAAFWEKLNGRKLLTEDKQKELATLIVNWEGALDFFYDRSAKNRKSWIDRALEASPRQVLRKILPQSLRSYLRELHKELR